MEGNEDGFLQINHSGQEPCEHVACALDGDDGSDDGDNDEDDDDHEYLKEIIPHLIEHIACTLDRRGRVGGFALETCDILIQKKYHQKHWFLNSCF